MVASVNQYRHAHSVAITDLHLDRRALSSRSSRNTVLCPGRGTTRQGRLWTYVRDDRPAASPEPPAVWFQYSPDRKGERPRGHLAADRKSVV